ncbi:MAG: PQQ-binding-like beta-propeller repeat protein [Candidatus Bathyarchaeota archaeon]|nr:PQQ-binding-like beta-propeller repeat protein [Candidatus Bathyarchaeota archaeon]
MTKKINQYLTIIAILLISVSLFALPTSDAHDPKWQIPTYCYVHVGPNPVGVGQTASVIFWINIYPPSAAGSAGDRWTFYIDITDPDGKTTSQGPLTSDPVGGSYLQFSPEQTGTYTITCRFPNQTLTGSAGTGIYNYNAYINDTYLESSATTTLTVQEEPIVHEAENPLPTEYWTRPINGQNNEWYSISSNWLAGAQILNRYQADGSAPNSAHVMWSKEFSFGGVVGGTNTGRDGMTYYSGTAYEGKMGSAVIMQGRLYYALPKSDSPSGEGYVCVDLLTGETLFWQNMTFPSFGQLYWYDSMNQHGVVPNGYLWASNFANAYDPISGDWIFSLTNVPSGTEAYTEKGEIVRYVINATGKYIGLWNNTAVHDLTGSTSATDYTSSSYNQWRPVGKTLDASKAFSWNISVPWIPAGATIVGVIQEDLLLGRNGSMPSLTSSSPYTVWAMSLKPESRGQLLWMKNYDAPAGNLSRSIRVIDPETRIFITYDQETMQWRGFSMDDGSLLWGPTDSEEALNFYALTTGAFGVGSYSVAYGNLYSTGYSGILYCYSQETGDLLWNYTAYAGLDAPAGVYSTLIGAIADDKVYMYSYEHSADAPHWKNSKTRCINATTGEEIWTIDGWSAYNSMFVADGYLVSLNLYDMQIYCYGKGASATTVTNQNDVITDGNKVLIKGTVTDIAAGTKQDEQAARFPNGVPVVSDASMSDWMEYVYMQQPQPTDVTGVTVSLSVIDANGNYRPIGETTTDADGFYSYDWQPDIPGKYTVIANFDGTESYYPSHAETAFVVQEVTPTETPTAAPQSVADLYFVPSIAGIFVLIIIVLALLVVLLLRKRP